MRATIWLLSGLLLAPGVAAAQSGLRRVENPIYQRWAAFPVGTWIEQLSVTETPSQRVEQRTKFELVEKTSEKLAIEMTVSITRGGVAESGPPQRLENVRWYRLPADTPVDDPSKPRDAKETGEEVIPLLGRDWRTTWHTRRLRVEAGETKVKAWYCDEVPGGLIQEIDETPAVRSTRTLRLSAISIPGVRP